MQRYLVFKYSCQPLGGWMDLSLDFATEQEATAYLDGLIHYPLTDFGHVVDTRNLTIVHTVGSETFPAIEPPLGRYIVFAFALTAPKGGWGDCIGVYGHALDAENAMKAAISGRITCSHVIDSFTMLCEFKIGPGPALHGAQPIIHCEAP